MIEFYRVDIRIGRIVACERFPAARKPAYKLQFDFNGVIPDKRSSAQLPPAYPDPRSLVAQTVACVTNFRERKIAGFSSQVLTLGMYDVDGRAWLVMPEQQQQQREEEEEDMVGQRVVLEDCDELPADKVVEVDDFIKLQIRKGPNQFVYYNQQRLGVRMKNGTFVPLVAPSQAEENAMLQ